MAFVGLDGCSTGWVAVSINGTARTISHLKTISELDLPAYDCAMIDIPIGLPDRGHRDCDLAAKKLLSSHSARVFTGARRSVLNYYRKGIVRAKASDDLKRSGDHGISCQLWALMKKIDEVDSFVSKGKNTLRLIESHPELTFFRLNQNKPLETSKKSKTGRTIRRDILSKNGFKESDIDGWLEWRLGKGIKADDVLDACACAIAARDHGKGYRLPPSKPERDAHGLPMRIWY